MSQDEAAAPKPVNRMWWRCLALVFFILALAIDTLPAYFGLHEALQEGIEPLLDKAGLWQGRWELFGPEPAYTNTALTADVLLADGSMKHWSSPDPRAWSRWQKFRNFRWNEYYDSVRLNDYKAAWPPLADWIAGKFQSENNPVVRVRLYRRWTVLNEESLADPDPFPFSNGRMFYRKEFGIP